MENALQPSSTDDNCCVSFSVWHAVCRRQWATMMKIWLRRRLQLPEEWTGRVRACVSRTLAWTESTKKDSFLFTFSSWFFSLFSLARVVSAPFQLLCAKNRRKGEEEFLVDTRHTVPTSNVVDNYQWRNACGGCLLLTTLQLERQSLKYDLSQRTYIGFVEQKCARRARITEEFCFLHSSGFYSFWHLFNADGRTKNYCM